MAGFLVFHGGSLLVHDHSPSGIRRALSQKIPHGAIELVPVGEPKSKVFFLVS